MKKFNIDLSLFTEHNSKDDAEMTMIATKEICKRMDCNIECLLNLYKTKIVDYKNYNKPKTNKREFINKTKELNKNIKGETIKVCFSHSLNIDKIDEKLDLINKMYDNGYSYESSLTKCDYFIIGKKKDKLDEACDYITSNSIKDIKKITMKEFLLMLKKENKKIKSR